MDVYEAAVNGVRLNQSEFMPFSANSAEGLSALCGQKL
jgi:hypothetical protein